MRPFWKRLQILAAGSTCWSATRLELFGGDQFLHRLPVELLQILLVLESRFRIRIQLILVPSPALWSRKTKDTYSALKATKDKIHVWTCVLHQDESTCCLYKKRLDWFWISVGVFAVLLRRVINWIELVDLVCSHIHRCISHSRSSWPKARQNCITMAMELTAEYFDNVVAKMNAAVDSLLTVLVKGMWTCKNSMVEGSAKHSHQLSEKVPRQCQMPNQIKAWDLEMMAGIALIQDMRHFFFLCQAHQSQRQVSCGPLALYSVPRRVVETECLCALTVAEMTYHS